MPHQIPVNAINTATNVCDYFIEFIILVANSKA
jgi:hypothetical protein